MKNSIDIIRKFAEKQFPLSKELKKEVLYNQMQQAKQNECFSDLTALISEHYYSKEKYDELLQQRDKLKEALERIADPIGYMMRNLKEGERLNGMMALQISGNAEYLKEIAEAAIKSTETK